MKTVKCSVCRKQLEYLGGPGPVEQWRGNVCPACNLVFCPSCIEVGGPTPCPKCHTPTHPATKLFLTKKPRGSPIKDLLSRIFGNREYNDLVNQLAELVDEAHTWGRQHGWPLLRKYPQYETIRKIGEKLDEIGGTDLMRKAWKKVQRTVPYPGFSEMWWKNVGSWWYNDQSI